MWNENCINLNCVFMFPVQTTEAGQNWEKKIEK